MTPADVPALTSFGRGYRLALTLADDELMYFQVPPNDASPFAEGHRRGLARRRRIGVGKLAASVAAALLSEETVNIRAVRV